MNIVYVPYIHVHSSRGGRCKTEECCRNNLIELGIVITLVIAMFWYTRRSLR